jgi:hypothetical protein
MVNQQQTFLDNADRILAESGLGLGAMAERRHNQREAVILEVGDLTEAHAIEARQYMSSPSVDSGYGPAPGSSSQTIRARHHRIAQFVAVGMRDVDIARAANVSTQTIANLRGNPAFVELVNHYTEEYSQDIAEFAEVASTLNVELLQHLSDQLEANPAKFDPRVTGELIKILADRTGHAPVSKSVSVNLSANMGDKLRAARERATAALQPALGDGTQ